jgi:hypothetical protein
LEEQIPGDPQGNEAQGSKRKKERKGEQKESEKRKKQKKEIVIYLRHHYLSGKFGHLEARTKTEGSIKCEK